jgi:predicted dehydrogenase
VKEIPIEKGEPLALELASFVEAVAQAKQPKVGAALGKSALEVAITITEQIRAGQK